MTVSVDTLRTHIDYSAWASARMVEAAAKLPEAELRRDFATADKSVLGTLVHVFGADRVWLARVQGRQQGPFLSDADYSMDVLRTDWPRIYAGWKEFAAPLTDGDVTQLRAYTDLKGNPWQTPLWQIVLHVVNHGTHHRGQAAGFLRSLGHAPPPLDLIAYYRIQR